MKSTVKVILIPHTAFTIINKIVDDTSFRLYICIFWENEWKEEGKKKGNGTYLGILKIKVSWDSQRGEKTSSRPLIW